MNDGGGAGTVDTLRGGGDGRPAATAGVRIYLFPESKAGEVVALMAEGREVVLCADRADFENRRDAERAVAVDLDRRVVLSFEKGEGVAEDAIEGEGARAILLGIRGALDRMMP